MKYLLDTCVISEVIRKEPDLKVSNWLANIDQGRVFLSVITIGEIQKGIDKLPASKRKHKLAQWLNDDLLIRFRGKIVILDEAVLLAWGRLTGKLERQGRKMPAMDSLIAASALQGNYTLVTRNEKDFTNTGVPIFNPWL